MSRIASLLVLVPGMILSSTFATGAQLAPTCEGPPGELATLIQTVRDRTTRVPLRDAVVTASWLGRDHVRIRTDSAGKVQICAPPDRVITVRVSYLDAGSTSETTKLSLARVTQLTSLIDVPAVLVRGVVIDNATGTPVQSVAVRLVHTPLITTTDAHGRFFFDRVPLGDYTLRVEHIAYSRLHASLIVRTDDLDAAIRLTPEAIPLEPVVVTAFSTKLEASGFYQREKRGVGTFIGRKQVEAMNVQRASDLLRKVPSARIIPQSNRRNNTPPNATLGRGGCRYRFLIDGTRTLADFEMDFVAPGAIEGVEVYNGLSAVPALFRAITASEAGTALCGVVVIWTRDRR